MIEEPSYDDDILCDICCISDSTYDDIIVVIVERGKLSNDTL